jgi:hypothetical protein
VANAIRSSAAWRRPRSCSWLQLVGISHRLELAWNPISFEPANTGFWKVGAVANWVLLGLGSTSSSRGVPPAVARNDDTDPHCRQCQRRPAACQ